MDTNGEPPVSRFKVELNLANNTELGAAKLGLLDPDKVRRVKILGVVDSGASLLVLPQDTVKQLGLPTSGDISVRYANNRTAKRKTVDDVYLELQGRHGTFTAIVEPKRDTALIGAIVLEALDLLVDCRKEEIFPRDPEMMLAEVE